MDAWGDAIMRWLEDGEGPLAYVVLGLAAMIEYVVPPFPGDTVALFGVFLASTADWSLGLVYFALNAGAVGGGMIAYAFGRAVASPERRPRWLRGARSERAIATITERYRRHGAAYLAVNRFVPALRAFFFIGAGIAGLRPGAVVLWGGVSAAIWNALLVALGWSVGSNWEVMLRWARLYSVATVVVLAVIAVIVGIRMVLRRRREGRASQGE